VRTQAPIPSSHFDINMRGVGDRTGWLGRRESHHCIRIVVVLCGRGQIVHAPAGVRSSATLRLYDNALVDLGDHFSRGDVPAFERSFRAALQDRLLLRPWFEISGRHLCGLFLHGCRLLSGGLVAFLTCEAGQHPASGASIELTSDPFRPLNRVHALRFLATPIESARLVERGLGGRQVLGSWPSGTFRLLHRCRAASGLALHVLRRLVHGHGWRMLLTCGVSRS
jgi:hypothetical protein